MVFYTASRQSPYTGGSSWLDTASAWQGKTTRAAAEAPRLWQVCVYTRTEDSDFVHDVALRLRVPSQAIATKTADKERDILEKKAWALAKSPFQMLLMTGLMLWMSGSSIQIFSIITLFMAVSQPVKALMSVKTGVHYPLSLTLC